MPVTLTMNNSDTLNIGISFNFSAQDTWSNIGNKNKVPIFLIGQAPNATTDFPVNKLTLIDQPSTANRLFGEDLTNNEFALPVGILQRYGCQRIICCRVTYPEEIADYDQAIIGLETPQRTGLHLIKSVFAHYGANPIAALICNDSLFLDSTHIQWITDFTELMTEVNSTYVENYYPTATVADVESSRSAESDVGWATKNSRLILCYGHVKDKDDPEKNYVAQVEPLKYHLVGAFAQQFHNDPSMSPGGQKLLGVSEVIEPMKLSTTDHESDNERITDTGVVTLNRISIINSVQTAPDDQTISSDLVLWGTRNTLYPSEESLLSFLHAIPFRDYIASVLESRAAKFLYRAANVANGRNVEESCREGLNKYDIKVNFIPELSNYQENYLYFEVEYVIGSVTQRIHFNVQLSIGS